jgi:hypothetical protein
MDVPMSNALRLADEVLDFGVLPLDWIDDLVSRGHSVRLEDYADSGKQLLRLTVSGTHDGHEFQWESNLDPSLGYRYTRFAVRVDGVVTDETTLSDFRDLGGYLWPAPGLCASSK